MKQRNLICSFLFLIGLNYAFCQTNKQIPTTGIKEKIEFSILENGGPSWVYKISNLEASQIEIQIRNSEDKILRSEKLTIEDGYISKLNVVNTPGQNFFIVILRGEKELYRKNFIK
ncbi:MAG: hypothetical protein V4635_09730 [Bacteroidota bacterium]